MCLFFQVTQQHRLSGVSYESGHSHKSYCSNSSSSVGSLDRLEESGYSSAVNVYELFQSGLAVSYSDSFEQWRLSVRVHVCVCVCV